MSSKVAVEEASIQAAVVTAVVVNRNPLLVSNITVPSPGVSWDAVGRSASTDGSGRISIRSRCGVLSSWGMQQQHCPFPGASLGAADLDRSSLLIFLCVIYCIMFGQRIVVG